MKKIIICLVLLPLMMAAGVYKWTDENGNVHFGDRPADMNKAETVKIRKQQTGSMVSDSTKARITAEYRYSAATPKKRKPVSTAPGEACKFAKNLLTQKKLKLSQLRKRGYKQYERAEAEDAIETWKLQVKTNCS